MNVLSERNPRRDVIVRYVILSWLALQTLSACAGTEAEAPPPPATVPATTLISAGISDNAAALAEPWASAYASQTERARINFVAGNNRTLLNDLDDRQLDAILVHHVPEGAPAQEAYWFNAVALDGLVVVLHPENPVASLSQTQVQGLFSGEIGNWSDVGGPDLAVVPVGQERGDGARTIFTRRVMGARPVSINTVIQSSSDALLAAVAAEPGAVGYTMMSALDGRAKPAAIDGVAPAPETTASQDYPLTVPLYFVSNGEPDGELRAWLAWLQGHEGQAIVSELIGNVR